MVFPVTQLSECNQERERVVTKGFMEREMRYAQEMREWPDRVAGRTRFLDGDTVKSAPVENGGKHPIIYRVSTIHGDAGFLP